VTIRRLLARAPDSSLDREDCRGREDIPLVLHHAALKTRNITTAVQFYSLLGFEATDKFRTGPARAAWLEQRAGGGGGTTGGRLEVIEVPEYMLTQIEGTRVRAPDLMKLQAVLGHNHVALDVTPQIHAFSEGQTKSLQSWMDLLNEKSVQQFGKTLRVALPPRQQIIGDTVYELAFLYDADGCLVELLHEQSKLNRTIESGWEPWDGQGFVGAVKG
jgi:catechol 2,3-dioxygenase-like lactoylglutathione lyase family enzyme